jgi:hypothetical protein
LEEGLDRLLQHTEEEATARQGATITDDYLDSATYATPIIGNCQGLVRGPTWSGRLEHWKGTKPSKFFKPSPPGSIIDSGKLQFQEGRHLVSSNEEKTQAAWSTKCFTPDREVFTIHIDKDSEGLEHFQLDDYCTDDGDYISDTLDQSMDVTMSFNVTNTIKIEDGDNA